MKREQTSLLGLMSLILVVALTLQAFRSAAGHWVTAYVNGVALLMIGATLRARFARDRSTRDWWFGFALFGWAYLILRTAAGQRWLASEWLDTYLAEPLIDRFRPFPRRLFPYSNARHEANLDFSKRAYTIFQMALTLLMAYLGALLSAFLGRRAARRDES